LKSGFFSKDVVVTAAGERVGDFESFKAAVWDWAQPDDFVQEILTNDFVENWWRRQRVRRCESAELTNRPGDIRIHDFYPRSDEIEALAFRFCLTLEQLPKERPRAHSPEISKKSSQNWKILEASWRRHLSGSIF
jgi:hypothetical protein